MKKCAKCDFEYDEAYDACPRCAQEGAKAGPLTTLANLPVMLGAAGTGLLFIGVFLPIVSLPIVGSVNYFNNGKGDGVVLIALALISAVLIGAKRSRGLLLTGGLSLTMLIYSFWALNGRLAAAQASLDKELAGNPFAGIAQAAMQSVQIQWGWAVLVLGAVLLTTAGALTKIDEPATDEEDASAA